MKDRYERPLTEQDFERLMVKYDHEIETVERKKDTFILIKFYARNKRNTLPLFSLPCPYDIDNLVKSVSEKRKRKEVDLITALREALKY